MKCGQCKQQAISFGDWGHGLRAFRYVCPHCGAKLRASRGTWIWFVVLLALTPVFILGTEGIAHLLGRTSVSQRDGIFALLAVPTVLGLSFVAWRTGSYRSVEGGGKVQDGDAKPCDPSTEPVDLDGPDGTPKA